MQPKKRGRKKKEELEAWQKEQEEIEKNLPLEPKWGVKKNSENIGMAIKDTLLLEQKVNIYSYHYYHQRI
ncbi:hypothetical protein U473_05285 [Tepidibacillus decaturensis]|uniref:Uncharacterized protein n=1 Tax=Tepidibacillus decaturensis TaxID=1413211 RepID=A0A135L3R1_9BACI|nr:hypothetical protein U473_05285 [Tepidibacillus decaturensis]